MFKYLIFICLFFSVYVQAVTPKIRVRIADALDSVEVSGVDITRYLWTQKSRREYLGYKKVLFNCKSKKRKRGYNKPIQLASIVSKTKALNFEKDKFKGKLHIQTSEKFNGCDVINEVSLEDYLATLLAKEMNAKWPLEALKAQAVAARSYAFYKMQTKQVSKDKGYNTYYDLENSERHQVNGSFYDATKKTYKASLQTKGEVLTLKKGKVVPVFFHSKCGGKTRRPSQVWSNSVAGYTSVPCPFCHGHGKKNWINKVSKRKMNKTLKKILRSYKRKYNKKGRVRVLNDHLKSSQIKFYVGDEFQVVKKSKLRSTLGRDVLPSNYFLLTQNKKQYKMIGSGYGHGVGMCQFGAKELAKQGYSYIQILKHYFPQLKINKIY